MTKKIRMKFTSEDERETKPNNCKCFLQYKCRYCYLNRTNLDTDNKYCEIKDENYSMVIDSNIPQSTSHALINHACKIDNNDSSVELYCKKQINKKNKKFNFFSLCRVKFVKDMKYFCTFCDYKTYRKFDLNRHIKKLHARLKSIKIEKYLSCEEHYTNTNITQLSNG